ncbi:MAG: glycosyltransferase [Anaerolineae bacterium]|nr:glycosyltransferase [Anaerolineae bacterium]MDW8098020.1 glycosyltransferase [Anaerolineae bacterium]
MEFSVRWHERQELRWRVCMLSVHTCPLAMLGGKETGGMNVYVRDLSRALGERGIAVDVFTRSQNPCVVRVSHELGPRCQVIHVPAGPEQPYDKNKVYDHLPQFIAGVKAYAAFKGHRYDLIHSHYWLSGAVAQVLAHEWQVPVIHMFHTLGELKNLVAQRPEERESEVRLRVEHEIAATADRLVAASPLEKQQLIELYGADPDRIAVVPCGVDLRRFHPIPQEVARAKLGLPREQRLVLFVGRIEPLKGIDTLIRAMPRVVEKLPRGQHDVSVAIIGGDASDDPARLTAEMARLRALRNELGLEDLVTFLGARSQEMLPLYYSAADVVVMPSHYESFGMVALEAMACGTPVIASRVGGLKYTVLHEVTGLHVPVRDPNALAEELVRLLTDRALRERLGSQAARLVQRYSWDVVVQEICRIYEELVPQSAQIPSESSCGYY